MKGALPPSTPRILRLKAFRKVDININTINIGKIKKGGKPTLFFNKIYFRIRQA